MRGVAWLGVLAACGSADRGSTRGEDGGVDGELDAGDVDAGPTRPAEEREVEFPSGGLDLVGTLHVPETRPGERHPGVVLVHGSGPNSRDETMSGQLGMGFTGPVAVFAEIAVGLSAAGYVVLRYDKRSCGSFNDCADNDYPVPDLAGATIDDYVLDAEAALDFLATVPEVDPDRLVYVGHSEGGQFAPRILEDREDVVAGVLLSGPHGPIDAIWSYQIAFLRGLLREQGLAEAEIDTELATEDEITRGLVALRAGTHDGSDIGGIPAAYWQSWMDLGDAAPGIALGVDRPLLALGGDYDWNVPSSEVDAWAETFDAATGTNRHVATVLPCLTHAFNCISEPDYHRIGPEDVATWVDDSVFEAMVPFLDAETSR